jgi:formylglycine-generating enzyme required for sulfatase activity
MGSQAASWGFQQDESPQHLVEVAPFYVDRAEITRRQYRACVASRNCSLPGWGCPYQGAGSTTNRLEKPIGCISSSQAADYCQWVGKRLPTAAEWEKTARGPFPRANLFPWGDAQDASLAVVDCPHGLNDCSAESLSYPLGASYYGALHMAGNVAEWVSDYYDPNFYTSVYTVAPEQTVDQGDGREVRGGSYDQALQYARVSNRAALTFGTVDDDAVGFRCAMDAP